MREPHATHSRQRLRNLLRLLWACLWVYLLISPYLLYRVITAAHAESAGADASASVSSVFGPSDQDPVWVAAKLALRVPRPTPPAVVGASIPSSACTDLCASYPPTSVLDTSVVRQTLEPPSVGTDAAGQAYTDHNMARLCGAGAVANALYFWGRGPDIATPTTYIDPSNGVATYWTTDHNRAYLLSLAWETSIPGWAQPGIMDTHNPTWGVTLYGVRDGLNWEASNHDANAWHTYFYTITWWNQSSADQFHQHVRDDIANAHVPVVAEVNARLLPNWPSAGKLVRHFITVVGYDDAKGTYSYTDTCGKTTGCGALTDGGVHTIPQKDLWSAISNIPVNTSTAYNAGDGGYVW